MRGDTARFPGESDGGKHNERLIEAYGDYAGANQVPVLTDKGYYYHWFVHTVYGAENVAELSEPISRGNASGAAAHTIDGRKFDNHESEFWDPSPAVVKFMFGQHDIAFVDNSAAGHIDSAIGIRNSIVGNVDNSWIDLGTASAINSLGGLSSKNAQIIQGMPRVAYDATANGGAGNATQSCWDTTGAGARVDESTDYANHKGRIDDWINIDVESPDYDPIAVPIGSLTGIMIEDQSVGDPSATPSPRRGTGGAPLQVRQSTPTAGQDDGIDVERVAGMVTRGDVQFKTPGGGFWTPSVVHVRDIVQLQPLVTTPTGSAISDGVLYYDANSNCLRLRTKGEWETLKTDDQESNPPVSGGGALDGDANSAIAREAAAMAAGDSYFLRPEIRVVFFNPSAPKRLKLSVSGFPSGDVKVYWRRKSQRPDDSDQTSWTELAGQDPRSCFDDEIASTVDITQGAGLGNAVVQLLAEEPRTGTAAGASLWLGRTVDEQPRRTVQSALLGCAAVRAGSEVFADLDADRDQRLEAADLLLGQGGFLPEDCCSHSAPVVYDSEIGMNPSVPRPETQY